MNKRNLRKVNKGLSVMGIEPMTEVEYAEMIEAANACHDHPNQWNTYNRPWPIHHMAIGPIYLNVEEHPEGIKAVFTLLTFDDDSVTGKITGCTSVDEAKRSLTFSIYKAITVDRRYAAAFQSLVRAKLATMAPALRGEMQTIISEILKPISGYTAGITFL